MSWWKICPVFFLLSFSPIRAAITLTFTGCPASADLNSQFPVEISLSCPAGCGDSYLRAVFYTPKSTNYFGFTKNNGGEWINSPGSLATRYFHLAPIDKSSPVASLSLDVKPDPSDKYFSGPGDYFFKVGRYTSDNSPALWSDPVAISLSGPPPTVTPVPTATPVPVPKTTSTSVPPTPRITPQPTAKPTLRPTLTPFFPVQSAAASPIADPPLSAPAATPSSVLAANILSVSVTAVPALDLSVAEDQLASPSRLPGIALMALGGFVMIISAYLLLKKSSKISLP